MTRCYSLLPLAALLVLFDIRSQARPINDALLDQYDYIIVGGGASGLTVANRLTEDPSVTVLVLEAGPVDQDEEWMRVPFFVGNDPTPPAGALSGHLDYDWNLGTEPQTYLDGKTRHYPLGRGVGGGTLINGMLWNRGNIGDYDDWATLIGDDGWSWDSMMRYFERSESFTADYTPDESQEYQIHSNAGMHGGVGGGVNVSYQGHFYYGTHAFYEGLNELGVPTGDDPNSGDNAGVSFIPMSIDPITKTRADARRSHYDPHASRDNLYVSSGQFVTRLLFADDPCSDDDGGDGTAEPLPSATPGSSGGSDGTGGNSGNNGFGGQPGAPNAGGSTASSSASSATSATSAAANPSASSDDGSWSFPGLPDFPGFPGTSSGPSGSNPSGSNPSGSNPSGSNPSGGSGFPNIPGWPGSDHSDSDSDHSGPGLSLPGFPRGLNSTSPPSNSTGAPWSNSSIPSGMNEPAPGTVPATVDGTSTNGQGRHYGLEIDRVQGGLSSGIGIFNLFPVGNLFDLLKSEAPLGMDANSGVEVHEVPQVAFDCSCSDSCPSKKSRRKPKAKKAKRQSQCLERVTGVEFATDSAAQRRVITAKREVILAAGAVHTPVLLQHSGIGDADFLETLGVDTRLDLPGVGNNYQDHFMISSNNHFQSKTFNDAPVTYADATAANRAAFWDQHTGPWTAGPPNGVAFPSLRDMSPNFAAVFAQAAIQSPDEYLVDGLDDSVIAGYAAQQRLLLRALADADRGQFEILNNNAGSFTYSIMKPLGRGQIRARSNDPFDTPVIDPRYGSNPVDLAYFTEALRFNHRLVHTDALTPLDPAENYPTAEQVADDDALLDLIKGGIYTEYHPTGTASMLPFEHGGVVDAELRVYGTRNLRIVDSSIMPLIPAAHLQACVFGVAEKAADLIRQT